MVLKIIIMHFIKIIKSLIKSPKSTTYSIVKDIYFDFFASDFNYSSNFIFIAGLPKSGTTWIWQIFNHIPGFIPLTSSHLRLFDNVTYKLAHPHDIHENMLKYIPKNKYSFLKLHTHYSNETIDILNKYNIKPLILIRDIRAMMLSRYHHIINSQNHWAYDQIANENFEDGFRKSLFIPNEFNEVPIEYYVKWINNWWSYHNNNPSKCFLIKYEEMLNSPIEKFKACLSFYGIEIESVDSLLDSANNMTKKQSSFTERLKRKDSRNRSTFRKGVPNEYENTFSKSHFQIFDDYAGDLLKRCGYKDHNNFEKVSI